MVCSPFLRKFYGVIVISNFTNRLVDIFKKRREIIMYIICGAATTLVSLLIYYVCAEFFFDVNNAFQLQIINVISWVLSVLFAFVTNKILVFKSKASPFKEMMRFYLARIGTLLIDMFLMLFINESFSIFKVKHYLCEKFKETDHKKTDSYDTARLSIRFTYLYRRNNRYD